MPSYRTAQRGLLKEKGSSHSENKYFYNYEDRMQEYFFHHYCLFSWSTENIQESL